MLTCTRCGGYGFLNLHQIDDETLRAADNSPDSCDYILGWMKSNQGHDVQVCDCCGDGTDWYGTPGEHYGEHDPPGQYGPYAYNGGLCECH